MQAAVTRPAGRVLPVTSHASLSTPGPRRRATSCRASASGQEPEQPLPGAQFLRNTLGVLAAATLAAGTATAPQPVGGWAAERTGRWGSARGANAPLPLCAAHAQALTSCWHRAACHCVATHSSSPARPPPPRTQAAATPLAATIEAVGTVLEGGMALPLLSAGAGALASSLTALGSKKRQEAAQRKRLETLRSEVAELQARPVHAPFPRCAVPGGDSCDRHHPAFSYCSRCYARCGTYRCSRTSCARGLREEIVVIGSHPIVPPPPPPPHTHTTHTHTHPTPHPTRLATCRSCSSWSCRCFSRR